MTYLAAWLLAIGSADLARPSGALPRGRRAWMPPAIATLVLVAGWWFTGAPTDRGAVGWLLLLPRAPAASPLSHLALCELVEGAKPLKNCSSSLARSFSADGARCVGFWDSAEAAGTGEQAGPCDWNGSGSWVTLLLVAAHGWIGLGTFIL